MTRKQKQLLQSFRAARDFLGRNALEIPLAKLDTQRKVLEDVVARLDDFQLEQDVRTRLWRTGTASVGHQVRGLRVRYLKPLARVARTPFVTDPALRRSLALPQEMDPEGTVTAALAMADAADLAKDAYLAAGFAPDFTDQLRRAAGELKQKFESRQLHRGRRRASTAALREQIARGRTVISLLDSIVAPALEDTPDLWEEWRGIRQQSRRSGEEGGVEGGVSDGEALVDAASVDAAATGVNQGTEEVTQG